MGWGVSKVFQSLSSGGERRTSRESNFVFPLTRRWRDKRQGLLRLASPGKSCSLYSVRESTIVLPVTRALNSHNSQRFMYPLPGGEETGGTIEVHFAVFSS